MSVTKYRALDERLNFYKYVDDIKYKFDYTGGDVVKIRKKYTEDVIEHEHQAVVRKLKEKYGKGKTAIKEPLSLSVWYIKRLIFRITLSLSLEVEISLREQFRSYKWPTVKSKGNWAKEYFVCPRSCVEVKVFVDDISTSPVG